MPRALFYKQKTAYDTLKPCTLCKTSAKVRWPYFLISSAVTTVTEAGASVSFCSIFDAPNTFGTSISIRASSGSSVRSAALGVGLVSAAGMARARNRPRNSNARRTRRDDARTAPTREARRERLGLYHAYA